MPQYTLLIYGDPAKAPQEGTPEYDAEMGEWFKYTESLQAAGAYVAGQALQAPSTATTIAVRDGERVVTDGPFADTKEWLAGYYVLDCPDLDTATAQAAKIPAARHGAIEVRPVMAIPGM